MQAFGLASAVAGKEIKIIELGQHVPGKEKRPFQFLLRIEELGLQAGRPVSWFVWADDIGPDGKVRRTTGDLYFAEVRPFEEIFREGQSMSAAMPSSNNNPVRAAARPRSWPNSRNKSSTPPGNCSARADSRSSQLLRRTEPDEDKRSADPSNRNSSLAPKRNVGGWRRFAHLRAPAQLVQSFAAAWLA